MTDRKAHWEKIYREKGDRDTSWFQPRPETSLALIEATGEPRTAPLIDVGGGTSRLVDRLLDSGRDNLTVLDISGIALEKTRRRLGTRATAVRWLEADLLEADLPGPWRIWHDRAVFHFLTDEEDRQRYLQQVRRHLAPGGHLVIATFGPEGPQACSGLPVRRYSPDQLAEVLGEGFELEETREELHRTPAGKEQSFVYCRFRYRP
jgi:SAM-dependent methyltransferase